VTFKTTMERFLDAQESIYETALAELISGQKRSHWMWFIFPQLAGLGESETASFYAIADAAEARTYLKHQILSPRLFECTEALPTIEERSANEIFGFPDDLKLNSSMTLFEAASGKSDSIFTQVLEKYFTDRCSFTLQQFGVKSPS